MKTTLKTYKVRELISGFVFNDYEGKGLFGLSGKLTIQPEYQRHYLYAEFKREASVIESLLRGYPLGLIYFNVAGPEKYEVLDGQQRITSIGRFVTGKFAIIDERGKEQIYSALPADRQNKILESDILVYHCEGTESEIKEWFKTINIAGLKLEDQELLNAVYSGPFVTEAKAEFSNSQNSNVQKWSHYIKGNVKQQKILEEALSWVAASKGQNIDGYMAAHRRDAGIDELKTYFNAVIDWIVSVFGDSNVRKEMCGLEWGRLYREYHARPYDPAAVSEAVSRLFDDESVEKKSGIFEYVLGGERKPELLKIRIFDEKAKRAAYKRQTDEAKAAGVSNCPLCAMHEATKGKVWSIDDMEADHVTAWSKGGATDLNNCQVLCKTHNRAKGNA